MPIYTLKKITKTGYEDRQEDTYHYESGDKRVVFYFHPFKAWHYVVVESHQVNNHEIDHVVETFITQGIGDSETFNERIQELRA